MSLADNADIEKKAPSSQGAAGGVSNNKAPGSVAKVESEAAQYDSESISDEVSHMRIHRKLNGRQVMFIAIAGSVGAALFIGIGDGLSGAGPLGLLLSFLTWMTVVWGVGQCQLEQVTLLPVDGALSELPARFVDPAWGAAAAWNMLILQGTLLTFETSSFNTMVAYWREFQPAIFISVLLFIWGALNIWRADLFGEGEFWLAIGKVTLAFMLMFYTLFVMCGANPQLEPFGFQYWNNPGIWTGDTSREQLIGFLSGMIVGTFVIVGPEYITILAGEAIHPRRIIPRAYNTLIYRLGLFFGVGALSVGILVPYTSTQLLGGGSDVSASPYVISMQNLGITVFPDIVAVLILTSIASAGNSYVFGGSRTLYQMALRGQMPKIFTRLNRHGTPYVCVIALLMFGCLSYLACGSGTSRVLGWITSFNGACTVANWLFISSTWLRFNNAIKKQGLDRDTFLPARSRFQPYIGWYTFVFSFVMLFLQGYQVFLPGNWEISTFIFNYGAIFVDVAAIIFYKVLWRTKFLRGEDVDLTTGLAALESYTQLCEAERLEKPNTLWNRISDKIF